MMIAITQMKRINNQAIKMIMRRNTLMLMMELMRNLKKEVLRNLSPLKKLKIILKKHGRKMEKYLA